MDDAAGGETPSSPSLGGGCWVGSSGRSSPEAISRCTSASRNTRPGQKKTRRDDSSSAPRTKKEGKKSGPGISNSSNSPRKQKEPPQDDPDDSDVALKTPRRVIPPLVDVSSGDHLHSISRSELDLNRALPLSSATAHARQARVDEVNAAAESIYIAAVKRHYIAIDVRKVERVVPIPFRCAANRTDAVQQLNRSIK